MTDTTAMFRLVIGTTLQFIQALEQIELLADRFSVDGGLAAACGAAAQAAGRSDLTATDFNNWLASVAAIQNANVGNVKAFFYKVL